MKIQRLSTSVFVASALSLISMPMAMAGTNDNPRLPCPGGGCGAAGHTASGGASFDWSINVGQASYNDKGNLLDYSRIGTFEGSVARALPRTLDDILSFYNGGGATNRQQLKLEFSSPIINASLSDPAILSYNHDTNAEVIEKNGYVNQVLTDTAFTHVDKVVGGFNVRVWSRNDVSFTGKINGLYPVPTTKAPIADITFSNPDHPADNNGLEIVTVENFGGAPYIKTVRYKETIDPATSLPAVFTIKTYQGRDTDEGETLGALLTIEELSYSNRGTKAWDYHIERKIWTAKTTAAGVLTPAAQSLDFMTLHNYEEYKDFSISSNGGEKGARRQTKNIRGYEPGGSTKATVYTYVDSPTNKYIHGKLKSITRPDGSWEYYEYQDTALSSVAAEVKYTSWKNVSMANRVNALKTATSVEPNLINRTTSIAGQEISKQKIATETIAEDDTIVTTSNWDGTEWHVSKACRYSKDISELLAGRAKWKEHADGTATTYSYAASGANTIVTTRNGAGNSGGVTSGTQTVQTLNKSYVVIEERTTDIASGLEIDLWTGTNIDNSGRPQRINYNDGTHSIAISGCCGLDSSISRTGVTTSYFRDALKRVYRVSRKRSSAGAVIDTTTNYSGLTTTTHRTDGTTTLLVSEATRSLDGLTTTSKSPDANGDNVSETTVRTMTYNAGGGTTTTTTYPDTTTTSTITFLDNSPQSTTDQSGNTTTYDKGTHTEQGGGLWSQTIAANTTQWTTRYTDQLGRSFKTQLADGALTTQTYHPYTAAAGSRGKLHTTTDPDENAAAGTGRVSSYSYNAEGDRTTSVRSLADGHTLTSVTTTDVIATVTIRGTVIAPAIHSTQSVNGITTSQSYRSTDGLISGSISLSGEALATRTIPADGAWTTTSTTTDGQSTIQTYTGGLLEKTESFGNESIPVLITSTSYGYDDFDRTTSTTDSRTGATTVNGYLENGAVISVTTNNAADTTAYTYDNMGRRLTTTLPDSSVTHTSYTDRGQTLATWGSQTYARLYQYDALGRMSELRTYQNLAHGTEPTTSTTGAATTTWLYDSQRGWLTEKNYNGETDDGTTDADYTYTASGRLKTRTWERGVVTTYTYDQGSLDTVTYTNDATNTPSISYTYDAFGRPATVTQGTNTHTYTYDAANLVLDKETVNYNGFIRTLDRSQDTLLRPNGWQLKNGTTTEHATTYSYDAAGRLHTVTDASSNSFTYGYEPNTYGLLKTLTGPAHTVTNTYEANRNVLTSKENAVPSTSSVVSNYAYTTNNLGQRTSLTRSGTASGAGTTGWTYNARGELTQSDDSNNANDRAFQYDGTGNRQKTVNGLLGALPATPNYTANALNQYTTIGSATPAYDGDGNATAYPLPVMTGGNATLIWDAENRLIEVKDGTTTVATYQYDYLGRRTQRNVGISPTVTTRYIYDGWNMITEYTGGSLKKSYTWGMDLSGSMQGAGGVGGLLAVADSASTHYPTYDGSGNVSEYLDSSSVVQAHYEYDAFGNTTVSSGAKVSDFAHRFSTKPHDAETGLYYYGYRYYDPTTGRWPSRDPIGERGGINLYGFVGNDGLNSIDLLGLSGCGPNKRCCDGKCESLVKGECCPKELIQVERIYLAIMMFHSAEAKKAIKAFDADLDAQLEAIEKAFKGTVKTLEGVRNAAIAKCGSSKICRDTADTAFEAARGGAWGVSRAAMIKTRAKRLAGHLAIYETLAKKEAEGARWAKSRCSNFSIFGIDPKNHQ